MKQVVVLQGVSGSGKSTIANRMANNRNKTWTAAIVSADDFFTSMGGRYDFVPAKLGQAHAECFRDFLCEMEAGTHLIIVDNTNSSLIEIAPYMLAASAFGYEAKILRVEYNTRTAYERGNHGVPLGTIEAMTCRINDMEIPPWWTLEIYGGN